MYLSFVQTNPKDSLCHASSNPEYNAVVVHFTSPSVEAQVVFVGHNIDTTDPRVENAAMIDAALSTVARSMASIRRIAAPGFRYSLLPQSFCAPGLPQTRAVTESIHRFGQQKNYRFS